MPSPDAVCFRHLLPYQNRWFYDDCSISYAEKSRRIGWTYASAARAVHRRLRLGTDLFYTSADLTAAAEFMEVCRYFARLFDALCPDISQSLLEETGSAALTMRFSNGGRIVAGSSNPKFFRSKGGDCRCRRVRIPPGPARALQGDAADGADVGTSPAHLVDAQWGGLFFSPACSTIIERGSDHHR